MDEQETLAFYNARAEKFTLSRKDGVRGYWDDELSHFYYYLPAGKIIEFGCGGGVEAESLAGHYDYLGTDLSEEFIRIAREGNPGLKFKTLSLYSLEGIEREYDGFWCCATLLHVPKKNIPQVLKGLHGVLRKGGVGFISIQGGTGEHMEVSSFAPELPRRLFAYYAQDEFRELLARAGFVVIRQGIKTRTGFTKKHEQVTWLSYYVRAV